MVKAGTRQSRITEFQDATMTTSVPKLSSKKSRVPAWMNKSTCSWWNYKPSKSEIRAGVKDLRRVLDMLERT